MDFIKFLAVYYMACVFADAKTMSYTDIPNENPLPEFVTLETLQGKLYCIKEQPSQCKKSCEKADILLVIDTSSSISSSNIKELTNQLQVFVEKFTVGPENVRIAASSFGSMAVKAFDFEKGSDLAIVKQQLDRIFKIRGSTALQSGLDQVISAFHPSDENQDIYKVRPASDVAKIALLFSDGNPTDPEATKNKVEVLKTISNLDVFAVGIGENLNLEQLGEIVSAPANLLTALDFTTSLADSLNTLATNVCKS